jgi:hypothetical protein
MTKYTYVFIRRDIPLHAQLVQSAHAALEMGLRSSLTSEEPSFLILLDAKDENHLNEIVRYLDEKDINSYMFFEPDYDMGHTSICTESLSLDKRKYFRKFNLWKHK